MLYRDGDAWKPVEATGSYGVELDQYNLVGIKAVTTSGLRLELQCQARYSAGFLEWKVEGIDQSRLQSAAVPAPRQGAMVSPQSPGVLPYHPTSSYSNGGPQPLNYMCDQIATTIPDDRRVRHMDFWPHNGTKEWAQYNFDTPKKVSSVSVFWWDDRPSGGCRVPASWTLMYLDGATWKPVEAKDAYGVERNGYNTVHITPITTNGLRIELQEQENVSAGIIEWKVE